MFVFCVVKCDLILRWQQEYLNQPLCLTRSLSQIKVLHLFFTYRGLSRKVFSHWAMLFSSLPVSGLGLPPRTGWYLLPYGLIQKLCLSFSEKSEIYICSVVWAYSINGWLMLIIWLTFHMMKHSLIGWQPSESWVCAIEVRACIKHNLYLYRVCQGFRIGLDNIGIECHAPQMFMFRNTVQFQLGSLS